MEIEKLTLPILGKKLLPNFDSKEFVEWAVTVLGSGKNSESLSILAGLDHDSQEIREKYFLKTIDELKINIGKSDIQLIENYVFHLSNQVISGNISPREGLKIMQDVVVATDYSSKYIQFFDVDEDLSHLTYSGRTLFNSNLHENNIEEFIRKEFELFLLLEKENIDRFSYFDKAFCNDCDQIMKPELKTKFQLKQPFKYQAWACEKCNSEKIDMFRSQIGKVKILNKINSNV